MADEELQHERIFTIPLRHTRVVPRTRRAPVAMRLIAEYITRHMKPEIDDPETDRRRVITDYKEALYARKEDKRLYIVPRVNEALWKRGREKPPTKIRVQARKFEDGLVEVDLPDE